MIGRMVSRRLLGMFSIALVLAAAAGAANVAPASGQDSGASVAINQVDAGAYPDITAVVTVLDAKGAPARGLTPHSFTATDGPDPLEVVDAQRVLDTSLSLGVVLVIDVSGSMEGQPLAEAKLAAAEFVRQLAPGDRATLLVFSGAIRTVVPFTEDRDALIAGVQGLQAGGDTSLYGAIEASAYAAGMSLTPRRAVVVLSDGENDTTVSQATETSSLAAAGSIGAPVYAIGYGEGADSAYLGRLAAETGGQFYAAGGADVAGVYATITEQLRGQYALTLRASAEEDGAEGALVVTANLGPETVSSAPATFVRGEAPPVVAPTAAPPPAAGEPESDSDSPALPVVLAVAAGIVIGAVILLVLVVLVRGFMARRRQRLLEREAGQQSDAPLPPPRLMPRVVPDANDRQARITVLRGERAGETVQFGAIPLVIGSDPTAGLRVAPSPDVAPKHAQLWVRDGKIMLRHTGGPRKTTAGGKAVDWLILDEGDEFSIGPHAYRVEGLLPADVNGPRHRAS